MEKNGRGSCSPARQFQMTVTINKSTPSINHKNCLNIVERFIHSTTYPVVINYKNITGSSELIQFPAAIFGI